MTSSHWPENYEAGIPDAGSTIVKWEHRPGHKPFGSYRLPKWVKHPDKQTPSMYLHPEDYMGSRKKHNYTGLNVAHVGAQCTDFEGQGFSMMEKATPAEINAQDFKEGWTPLHWAVLCDNPKAVIWLLKHGADRDIEDFAGRKAEDMVEEHWGELGMRKWEGIGPKKDKLDEPAKMMPKKLKTMKEAFKQNYAKSEFDSAGYQNIVV
mmetsp:Transcript_57596/g.100774  ORF Transcript_57596/g.100774 Transcript_57596/m.100774 type:complete len:207 (-) Transcript_57596:87-707(-)